MRIIALFSVSLLGIAASAQVIYPSAPVELQCNLSGDDGDPTGQFTLQTRSGVITVIGIPQKGSFIKEGLLSQKVTTSAALVNFTMSRALLSYGQNRTSIAFQQSGSSAIDGIVTIDVTCTPQSTLFLVPPEDRVTLVTTEGAPVSPFNVTIHSFSGLKNETSPVYFTMVRDCPFSDRLWISATSVNGSAIDTGSIRQGQTVPMTVTLDTSGLPTQPLAYHGVVRVRDMVAGIGAADLEVDLTVLPGVNRPTFTANGVKNSGSGSNVIAPGSWASIFGASLAPDTVAGGRSWSAADFDAAKPNLPTSLDNVRVLVGGVPAAISFLSNTQINFQVPDVTPGSAVSLIVTTSRGTSAPAGVTVQSIAPALFALIGTTNPVAQHLDFSLVGTGAGFTPARSGETIILYGTGFGPTAGSAPAGMPVNVPVRLSNPVRATVNGIAAKQVDAFLIAPGLVQLNLVLPDGLPSGESPLSITVNGFQIQSNLTISIR